jgi:hypothetical protein
LVAHNCAGDAQIGHVTPFSVAAIGAALSITPIRECRQ